MTEETPTEATPEPRQTKISEGVNAIVNALKLAKLTVDYKKSSHKNMPMNILCIRGPANQNPTLEGYIKTAERLFIQLHSKEIIEHAKTLLEDELEIIRTMLAFTET